MTGSEADRGRITINDVADHLALSKGTVSRALNGYDDIAEATRLRVVRAAERLGYRPLSHAQAIRNGRSRALGLVIDHGEHDHHRPFIADFLAGISTAASEADWTLTVATAANMQASLNQLRHLNEDRKADGFIVPRTMIEDPRISYLQSAQIPYVLYGRSETPGAHHYYDIRGEDAMADAVSRLAALGHSRIAFVGGGAHYMYACLRHLGYRDGLARAGIAIDPVLEDSSALDRTSGARATAHLLDLDQPPTAIVFAVDRAALGAWDIARERGLRIGTDLSVVGYDGIAEGAYLDPPLASYDVNNFEAGKTLASILIRVLRGYSGEPIQEYGQAMFLDRGSVGPCPAGDDPAGNSYQVR
ncbi:LacI family DNA-binding transcriptional regulator [Paracoccus saliphilus]|uniref:Substrate-binding domain-containing protein n=1 Tax=Paracoccus saliphilus TaxID=405559 RepID=A0AA46A600_9RHOB|nr:substrate-binding domain-containing protein [Paracoccus saliphilus]WCR02106.1 substrate-binding domain-containing protein [Paracoccus saliphilus]SIS90066.1 transcriptional regulator, LacI family [Paracoccus saliphilus]